MHIRTLMRILQHVYQDFQYFLGFIHLLIRLFSRIMQGGWNLFNHLYCFKVVFSNGNVGTDQANRVLVDIWSRIDGSFDFFLSMELLNVDIKTYTRKIPFDQNSERESISQVRKVYRPKKSHTKDIYTLKAKQKISA